MQNWYNQVTSNCTLTGGLTILKGALFDQFRHFESRLLSLKFTCLSLSFLNFNSFY